MGVGFNRRRTGKRKLVLFENGVLSPLLGNLKKLNSAAGTYYLGTNSIGISQSGTNYSSTNGYFGFDNPISTKGYKFIHFDVSCSSYAVYNNVGINDDNTSGFDATSSLGTNSRHVVTVPISQYQGNYYIVQRALGYGSPETGALTTAMHVYRIWLDNSETGE